ncbi:sensor domain-containing diguanylate cyclase [Streptomyces sp. ST2-7A]|uniref:sensor domain-containing diguanylate cyclase n=1 Tax=Streptomyces sp. ST2-7A TaxID=2907214 RepID=UPI001F1F0867|nr:sensor domain-containing diguanylate cyclase [Streptomyces sp. ST2-7A]MCE7083234.1 sensor domain-containing diguanylate cyclase [Streptomyces sp. ST2-7A]
MTAVPPGVDPGPGESARGAGSVSNPARPSPTPLTPTRLRIAIIVLCAGYALGAGLGWGSPRLALVMGDFGLALAALAACVSCLWYARTRAGGTRHAWLLFGLSSLMIALGNGVWGWYEVVLDQPVPRTSPADLCFLLFAPCAVVGLLLLARRPSRPAGWLCLGLDAWLVAGSLFTLSWSLAITRLTPQAGESVLRSALALAYPLLDIVLVSTVLVLHLRRSAAQRAAVNAVIGAFALTVLCDFLFGSPLLREQYSSGQLLDAGWFAGSVLLAGAPWMAGREIRRRGDGTDPDAPVPSSASPGPAVPDPDRFGFPGGTATHPAGAVRSPDDPTDPDRPGDTAVIALRGPTPSLSAFAPYLAAAVCVLGALITLAPRGGPGTVDVPITPGSPDWVVVATTGAVVLALLVRQAIMLADNICLTRELARQEHHFRSLVQGSSDVIMIAGPDGALRYVSPAAAVVWGTDPDRLVGRRLAGLVHPEDMGGVLYELRRFLTADGPPDASVRVECRIRHGAGHWLNVESCVNRHRDGLVLTSRDVTERVRLQERLRHHAFHDPLTGLPNRALFTDRMRRALGGRRAGDSPAAVLYIDLDGFKAVNDTIGHQAGDDLLVQAARRLRESVRAGDTTARLGGDEFAALIVGDPGGEDEADRRARVVEIAERVRVALSRPYRVGVRTAEGEDGAPTGARTGGDGPGENGTTVRIAASIGIAFADPGVGPAELLRRADLAMYRAKQGGKGRVVLCDPMEHAGENPPRRPADGSPHRGSEGDTEGARRTLGAGDPRSGAGACAGPGAALTPRVPAPGRLPAGPGAPGVPAVPLAALPVVLPAPLGGGGFGPPAPFPPPVGAESVPAPTVPDTRSADEGPGRAPTDRSARCPSDTHPRPT